MNISERILYRKRVELNPEEVYTSINDCNLDSVIRNILFITQDIRKTYIIGSLKAKGIFAQGEEQDND